MLLLTGGDAWQSDTELTSVSVLLLLLFAKVCIEASVGEWGEGLREQRRGLRDSSHASSGAHRCTRVCVHTCMRYTKRVPGWAVTADAGRGLERSGGGRRREKGEEKQVD